VREETEQRLVAASRERAQQRLEGRDRRVAIVGASTFLVAASSLVVLLPTHRSLSLLALVILVPAMALASLVEFEVGSGHAVPTQLVLVPMLFALPVNLVPLAAAGGYLIAHGINMRRRQVPLDRALVVLGSSWYALGPAIVLGLAGEIAASIDRWPLLLAAFAAQVTLDALNASLGEWFAHRTPPRVLAPFLIPVYLVDLILAPIALCVAIGTPEVPLQVGFILPLVGLLGLFAHERHRRLDQTLELSAAYRGTALLLGDVIEADDAYTGTHSRGVLDLVLAVADELRLDEHERRDAELTALLHDVGKIAIPKTIINKPGPLDGAERAVIETHTVEGEAILQRVGGALGRVGGLVRSCHERWDGTGYPDGLRGEAIPLVARVVFACDAYNAMTTDRPYRAAGSTDDALAELNRCAGTHFDPKIVGALARVIARGRSIIASAA
jgi:HD-GYP domain-containing protein (c-di-GMP phosphodiesterase class II)